MCWQIKIYASDHRKKFNQPPGVGFWRSTISWINLMIVIIIIALRNGYKQLYSDFPERTIVFNDRRRRVTYCGLNANLSYSEADVTLWQKVESKMLQSLCATTKSLLITKIHLSSEKKVRRAHVWGLQENFNKCK